MFPVSSAPEGLIVTNITSDGAIISWGEPANKNGEILSYRISMNTTGPEHYVPPNCSVDYDTSFNYTTELTTLSYVFDKGLPNFHYIVSVAAATIAGYGAERTIEFTTGSVGKYNNHFHHQTTLNIENYCIIYFNFSKDE